MLHLEEVLQRLYDSEINVTITMLWDGGFDFVSASYMTWPEIGTPQDDLQSFIGPPRPPLPTPWHSCEKAGELAEAIHKAALESILNRPTRNCMGGRISEGVNRWSDTFFQRTINPRC